MGWGLSEGQWPQLAMEGPVMNVQRQSRTLQQNHHQFSSCITQRLVGTLMCNVSLYMCTRVYLQIPLCLKKVWVCVLKLKGGKGLKDYSCLLAVGRSWAMLPIGHSHEPLLFKGHGGRQQWGQGSVITTSWTIHGQTANQTLRKKCYVWVCMSLWQITDGLEYKHKLRLFKTIHKHTENTDLLFNPFLLQLWDILGLTKLQASVTYQQVLLDVRSARLSLWRAWLGQEWWALCLRNQPEKRTHTVIRAKNPKQVMDFTSLSWFYTHPLQQRTCSVKEIAQIIMLPLP